MSLLVTSTDNAASGERAGVPRILVVDDEQHMCDVCSRTLRRGGYEVMTTSDPKVAVELLRTAPAFDLLLTDIKMPTMSGLDLAYLARERDPAIAIIIMTGFASMENLHQSVQRGVADFLSKPFELDQLRLAVDQALHKRSLLQDNIRLHALEQLLVSSTALGTTLELGAIADALLHTALAQSGYGVGFVLLWGGQPPLELTSSGPQESVLSDAGRALASEAFQQQQMIFAQGQVFGSSTGQELRAALAVPLRAQADPAGVLLLCDEQPTALLPGAQEELALLANYAGAALRNALLYRQLGDAYLRLQELDRLKGEFIAVASHELRTPLAIILGYTMMLRDQQTGEQRDYIKRVMQSAQRIKDIVDDMVSLRHLETGETQAELEQCELAELIEQAVDRNRVAVQERRHELVVEPNDPPIVLLSDRERFLLILSHLISNAVKFTPEGGRIVVRAAVNSSEAVRQRMQQGVAPAATTSLDTQPAWVAVEVQDSGIGIPEREQRRIFDRFYQIADSLTRDHGGAGLGLAIVRELVIALGGVVWVASREGQGSTFGFALPHRN